MSLDAQWAETRNFAEQFIFWSHLVINGVVIWGFIQNLFQRWRNVPTEQRWNRLIDGARTSFVVLALVAFAVLYIDESASEPKPFPPVRCTGMTIGKIDKSGKLVGQITPGNWQYQISNGEITGPKGQHFNGHILPDDWCIAYPKESRPVKLAVWMEARKTAWSKPRKSFCYRHAGFHFC